MVFQTILLTYYWIKNHIKPIDLPKYKWLEVQLSDSLNYEWTKAKFYATKKWVEIYAWMFGNNDDVDRKEEKLIIPMWKVISYNKPFMKIYASKGDYKRYLRWHKK